MPLSDLTGTGSASSDGGAKVTYCRDPEGVIVELVEILKK